MTVRIVREAEDSPQGTKDAKGGPSYTRTFIAACDSVYDGPKGIINHPAIPQIGDPYSFGTDFDPLIPVSSVAASRSQHLACYENLNTEIWTWEVTVDYKLNTDSDKPPNQPEDPLARPVEIRGGSVQTTLSIDTDKDDDPILNSAKEQLPPIELPFSDFEIEFVRNEASSPAAKCIAYVDKVNSGSIWGGDARTWRCVSITFDKKYEGLYEYYVVSYKFNYKVEGHILQLVDNGFNELIGGTTLTPILLEDGTKPSEPFKLNGSGLKLDDDDPPVLLDDIYVYQETDFSTLGLSF